MSKFVNLFSLSVYRDVISLDSQYRQQLIQQILDAERKDQKPAEAEHSAWLGDTQGHEFLFQNETFQPLFQLIGRKVREYTEALGLDTEGIDFYFQRAWATVTRRGERVHEHSHEQSNISAAYYLCKPANSGGISFINYDHPNEISNGIFTPSKQAIGFIKKPSLLTWNTVCLDPKEDDVVVFPSKAMHSTVPSETDSPRISIASDVVTMLRDSRGHETMMPHFSHWRRLE